MNRFRLYLAACLLVCLSGIATTVMAQDDARLNATLQLDPLEAQAVGTRPTVTARLLSEKGQDEGNKVLKLYLDGERVRRIRTNESGVAEIRISRDLPVGSYQVEVVFEGTEAYKPTSASMTLIIRPIQLTIETVPPLANVTFKLEDQTFVSDANGLGFVEISEPGTYQLNVLDVSDIQVDPDTRATFSRWKDAFQPNRTVEARGDMRVQAGFNTYHPIGLAFVDLAQESVDETRVTSVTLKRSDGSYFTFENTDPQWLMATRVVRRREGLEAAPLLYSVESVMIDGTSTVNRYEQRFYVEGRDTWKVELLLYSLRIRAKDAIFGFLVGNGIMLQYPDGHTKEFEFGENKEVFIPSLARGLYHVQVRGVAGMTPLTPTALSKDQDATLVVLSALDIGAGVTLGVVGALALLLFKRFHLFLLVLSWLPLPGRGKVRATATAILQSREIVTPSQPLEDSPLLAVPLSTNGVVNVTALPLNGETWLLERFHPDGFKCPKCGHVEARVTGKNRRNGLVIFRCCVCHRRYTLYTGTPFHASQLTPAQSKRLLDDSALDETQLAEELGLTKKTVRKWQQRLQATGESVTSEAAHEPMEALPNSVKDR
jgi:transposase-like protein